MSVANVVSLDVAEGVAWITIDNPPINALSQVMREGLRACAAEVEQRHDVFGVVLRGAGRCFVAGADIGELGKPLTEPFLPDVLSQIAQSRAPWVAVLHGVALGGGMELALACHGRIAQTGTRLGFPEVNLGIIPGAGGTVRLPRLIPVAEAVQMITSGKPIDAGRAHALGLVDRLVEDDLEAAAVGLLTELSETLPAKTSPIEPEPEGSWADQEKALMRRSNGQRSPIEALHAAREAVETDDPALALKAERARFLRLVASEEAAALRHVFFAERRAADGLKSVTQGPVDLELVGVVGGGTMGAGIAAALLLKGSRFVLIEQSPEQARCATKRVHEILAASAKRGLLSETDLEYARNAFIATEEYTALSETKLVIEAVFEDAEVKAQVFARLDETLPSDAILATNTSYLDVDMLAEATRDPSRVQGLHFFSPAYAMKLLEVVKGRESSDTCLATAGALAKRLGKTAIVSGVRDGFIANRIMARYRAECEIMLEEGALPQEVDAAMRNFGYKMGVFEVQDLAGLDIAWAMRKRRADTPDAAKAKQSRIPDILCEAGRFGRKAGIGWYRYEEGKAMPDPWVEDVIKAERDRLGHPTRAFSEAEIMDRILRAMQDEGAKVVEESIAQSSSDIDVAMILGHGFPRHKGGPMYLRQIV